MIFKFYKTKFRSFATAVFLLPFISKASFSSTAKNFMAENVLRSKARLALCQVKVTSDKAENIKHVENLIKSAVESSTTDPIDLVVLPEVWNSPYSTSSFPIYAELVPPISSLPAFIDPSVSPSTAKLSELAKQLKIWIIGGSIPEYDDVMSDKTTKRYLYNTCVVINSNGQIVAKHRKMHLFDIDIPGKMTFKESDSLTAGNQVTVFDSPWGKIGIGICYDIRFPEYAMLMRQQGCKLLVYPGAFNMVTGPAHWELLQRCRAVDNQLYVAACSPARDTTAGYVAWGHSSVVSPWGDVVCKAGHEEETIYADIDIMKVEEMRQNIPCLMQKRNDIYSLIETQIDVRKKE